MKGYVKITDIGPELVDRKEEMGELEGGDLWDLSERIGELDIPSRVGDIFLDRLDVLSEKERDILHAASVVGYEFTSDLLMELLQMDKLELLKALDTIEKKYGSIHSDEGVYRFDHKMLRKTLYSDMGEELRREYHRITAEAYEERYQGTGELVEKMAHHYLESGDERAGKYLLDAAERARERYANEEAKRFYRNSLGCISRADDVLRAYEGLADVYSLSGKYEQGNSYYRKALDFAGDQEKMASLHRKISGNYENIGEYEKSLEECSRGLELMDDRVTEGYLKLLNSMGWIEMREGDYDRAEETFREAKRSADSAGLEGQDGEILHSLGTVLYMKSDYDGAVRYLDKAVERHRELGSLDDLASSFNNLGLVFWRKGGPRTPWRPTRGVWRYGRR